jgi:hypothetical protein
LFGVMEAVESASGLVGPMLGGLLYRAGENVPLATVVGLYAAVFVAVWVFYTDCVVAVDHRAATATDAKEKKEQ